MRQRKIVYLPAYSMFYLCVFFFFFFSSLPHLLIMYIVINVQQPPLPMVATTYYCQHTIWYTNFGALCMLNDCWSQLLLLLLFVFNARILSAYLQINEIKEIRKSLATVEKDKGKKCRITGRI